MLGGIDISLNDDTQKKLDIGWQPQFYGFADVVNLEPLSKVLRDTYSPTKKAPGRSRSKSVMVRRGQFPTVSRPSLSGVSPTEQKVGPPDNRRKCWHTRKVLFAQLNTSGRCFGCT